MITFEKISEIVNTIATNYKPDKIILFGSYANGDYNNDSDLDFIIIKKNNLPKYKRSLEIKRLFYGVPIPIDMKIYTPIEFDREIQNKYSFLYSALLNSKLIYERKD